MQRLVLAALLLSSAVFGQDIAASTLSLVPHFAPIVDGARKTNRDVQKSWKLSLVPLLAAQSLDTASSWGQVEENPLLAGSNGRFGMRSAGVKFSIVGIAVLAEYLIGKSHPKIAGMLVHVNRATAIVTAGTAVHNFVVTH